MKYIVAIDIGGTTFKTGIFSDSLSLIKLSNEDKIRYYSGKKEIVCAIINQVNNLIEDSNIKKKDIMGVGIASPGPLDSKQGIILNTPNIIFIDEKVRYSDFFDDDEMGFYKNVDDLLSQIDRLHSNIKKINRISKNGKRKYFSIFNNQIISDYIISKTFNKKGRFKYIWE